jgi:hypothetical protein
MSRSSTIAKMLESIAKMQTNALWLKYAKDEQAYEKSRSQVKALSMERKRARNSSSGLKLASNYRQRMNL